MTSSKPTHHIVHVVACSTQSSVAVAPTTHAVDCCEMCLTGQRNGGLRVGSLRTCYSRYISLVPTAVNQTDAGPRKCIYLYSFLRYLRPSRVEQAVAQGGRANASPDFHTKGQEQVFTLPLFNGFTPYGQTEIR